MTTHTTHGRQSEPHPLAKVISGGQTGVDQAALRAARACGIPTGGWMPKGYRTLDGPKPGFAALYGVKESRSGDYAPRTHANVTDAHATLRLASVWGSPGEVCTARAIADTGRPSLDVTILAGATVPESTVRRVADWLRSTAHGSAGIILNVAGNSEQTAPGIGAAAETFLRRLFVMLATERVHTPPASGLARRLPSMGGV